MPGDYFFQTGVKFFSFEKPVLLGKYRKLFVRPGGWARISVWREYKKFLEISIHGKNIQKVFRDFCFSVTVKFFLKFLLSRPGWFIFHH